MESGVHYLALSKIKEMLKANEEEYKQASAQLQEAIKMGDLRENSEYDAAKESMGKIMRDREMLLPVLSMPVIKSSDSVNIFEPGCVLDLKVYGTTAEPIPPNSNQFKDIMSENSPVFEGIVMLGGTLPIQELLVDSALDIKTPVGKFLLGKQSGCYTVPVMDEFVIVSAKRLKSTEFSPEDIGCSYNGEV